MYKSEIDKQEREQWDTAIQVGKDSMVHWKEIATTLYNGYKDMINGVPWTEEGVKRVDEAIKEYEQLNKEKEEQLNK